MTCGIYCITNNINGMKYVGQSVCIEERFIQHIEQNSNSKIHEAIVTYGVSNFKFEIIVQCSPQELDEQEVKFIRLLESYENGYNQTRGGQHHVFNVEYEYEEYLKLKDELLKLKDELKKKNEVIKSLKKDVDSLTCDKHYLLNYNKDLESKLAKKIGVDISPTNIFYDLLLEKNKEVVLNE